MTFLLLSLYFQVTTDLVSRVVGMILTMNCEDFKIFKRLISKVSASAGLEQDLSISSLKEAHHYPIL